MNEIIDTRLKVSAANMPTSFPTVIVASHVLIRSESLGLATHVDLPPTALTSREMLALFWDRQWP